MTAPPRSCGSCTLCCKLMSIDAIGKPTGQWCWVCAIGKGCQVYDNRPEACRAWSCLWILRPELPDDLRPDRCKVVMDPQDGSLVLHADPQNRDSFDRPALVRIVEAAREADVNVLLVAGKERRLLPGFGPKGAAIVGKALDYRKERRS